MEAQLERKGIASYLPMVPSMRQWKDRKRLVHWPLFPGYVFGRFALRQVHDVLVIPGVSTIVRANGQPAPVPDDELENVRRFAAAVAQAGVVPEARPLIHEGDWVRVVEGAFAGVQGRVVERRGRRRVLVGLGAIAQGLEVDIDVRLLKVVPAPSWAKA